MAVLGCHLAPADPLDRSWFEYRSQNFVVLSDAAEADVRARIDDLELFRAVVLKVTNVRAGPSGIPVEVYLFSSRADFRSTTTSDDIAGYMIPGLRVQYMASGPDMFQLNSQQVLFHEYVHYLVRNGGAAAVQPPWYDEGLADMLASTELRPDKVVLGGDFPARIQSINEVVRLSLRDVVEARRIPQKNIYARANYYGLAFAFVNYLHVARFAGARDRLPQLQTYLRLVSNARPSAALFEQAFGTDYAHMDRELTHFLGRATRPVLQLPRSLFNHDASYRRRAVGRQEIAYRLGYLTLLQAPQNAARLFQLDGLPARDARFRAGIGVVKQLQGKFGEADADMRAALALAPDDPVVLQEFADLQPIWCALPQRPQDCATRVPEAARAYGHILQIAPDQLETHFMLGSLALDMRDDAKSAIAHFEVVLRAAPWSIPANGSLGLALQRAGDNGRALPFLRRAAAWTEQDSPFGAKVVAALGTAETEAAKQVPPAATGQVLVPGTAAPPAPQPHGAE